MRELPIGWINIELNAVAQIIRGVTYKREQSINESKEGFLPILRATNITGISLTFDDLVYVPAENILTEQLLLQGDVVIASSSGSKEIVGKAGSFLGGGFIGSFGAFCTGLRPSTFVVSSYFRYYFQTPSYRKSVSELSAGSNINNLKIGNLAAQQFPLPPAAEQTRIVEKLEELLSDLDAGVAELKAAQKKLAQYRQSLLKAAVEGTLTAEWRAKNPPTETGAQLLERILIERRARWEAKQLAKFKEQDKTPPNDWQNKYPEPVHPDTRDLPELPDGWVWSMLGECFKIAIGSTPSRKEIAYWNGPISWVSSGEVRFNRVRETKEKITEFGLENSSTQINPVGSVLLGMIGEGKTRGQVAILDIPAANNQNSAAIWVSETPILPEYVYYWLWSQYEQTRRGSSGNNQPALNKFIIERILIPLPPVAEMQEVVQLLDDCFEQIMWQEATIDYSSKQSTAQRQNILRAAFSGQLVPQDPNDEPASVLLERIRNERQNTESHQTKRTRRRAIKDASQ
ncbi:MAG TPA: restriction endonuclease subunit S [Candidatus Competibacteraceae bacterium]|nr:restriction endonuclease subunit S [Candidatus Competibacteraceae bacterium]HQD57542.1 restriction endonuclease subunit S [Candidatus Competibacteraceae bacterium]